jgi:hypothetical protein
MSKLFWEGETLFFFSVECDRFKGLELVGENRIKIGLTIGILCAKRRKRKN